MIEYHIHFFAEVSYSYTYKEVDEVYEVDEKH